MQSIEFLISDLLYQNFAVNVTTYYICFNIWIITFIHLNGINLVSKINNIGVVTEMIGVLMLIIFLGYFLLNKTDIEMSLNLNDYKIPDLNIKSFALSILLGAWCLTGFEAAADMSEETKNQNYCPKIYKIFVSKFRNFGVNNYNYIYSFFNHK